MLSKFKLVWFLLLLLAAACSEATPTTSRPEPTRVQKMVAKVSKIDVLTLAPEAGETPEVRLVAQVELPDPCTVIDEINTARFAQAFRVTITVSRMAGVDCPSTPQLVDRIIPLDVAGLPAGAYQAVVNEAVASFTLEDPQSRKPAETEQPGEAPAAEPTPTGTPASPEQPGTAGEPAQAPSEGEDGESDRGEPCEQKVGFFGDVTVPDDTFFRREERFTKTWKLRNEGTCTWGEGYALAFAGGELLNAPLAVPLVDPAGGQAAIAPGDIFTVSVNMAAPAQGGTYVSRWLIQDPAGVRFGLGASRQDVIYVRIVVGWVDPFGSPGTGGDAGGPPGPATCGEERDPGFESQVLSLLNTIRVQNGLRQLSSNPQLVNAALGHSTDMACNNFTSHTGSNGSTFRDRISAQGYTFTYASENIYYGFGEGFGDPQTAVDWWMNSQEHRENILNPYVTEIGIGYVYYASSQYGGYYTVNFARP